MELAELKNVDFNLKDFCMDIVKYQNFKPKYAIPNIRTNYKEATVRNLFSAGVSYIKFGKKSRGIYYTKFLSIFYSTKYFNLIWN